MKIAVISDIHGNCVGLDAALADMEGRGIEQVVCLGDAVQGGPQPVAVVARLRALGCPVVMGNADALLVTGDTTGAESPNPERQRMLHAVREWMLTLLSADDLEFIAAFHPTVEIPLTGEKSLLCFHGSPTSFNDLLFPTSEESYFQNLLTPYLPRIMTGGHTHLPHMRRIGVGESFFFNPGSIGFAYTYGAAQAHDKFRADPWAEYAILMVEAENIGLEFRRVPYDVNTLIEVYRASGRPYADVAIAQYQ